MALDLLIKGGQLVTEVGVIRGGVGVRGGRIAAILEGDEAVPAEEVVDAHGLVVLPGGVDPHVHFNEPGRAEWEGIASGTLAAAAGGITTVLDMPLNSTPPLATPAAWQAKVAAAKGQASVDYGLWAALFPTNRGVLDALAEAGACGFKAFMCPAGTEFEHVDSAALLAGLRALAPGGRLVGVHAENADLVTGLQADLEASGRRDPRAWLEARPAVAELEAIERALLLAREARARLHVVHLSIADGLRVITAARGAGQPASTETCPHYLLLTGQDLERLGPVAKCAPPLRTAADADALWRGLAEGEIDCVVSDHSPCPWELKAAGERDIWAAWGGISSVQFTLPLLWSEGMHRRRLSPERLAAVFATNAARLFGLYPRKGAIRPGADADLVLLDPDRDWTIGPEEILFRHRHTPYLGRRIRGRVRRTLVRGRTVFAEGGAAGLPGHGELLRPRRAAAADRPADPGQR